MKDIPPAVLPAKLVVARAHIDDDGITCFRKIRDAEKVLRFQIGQEQMRHLKQGFGISDDVAVLRRHLFVEVVGLTEKAAGCEIVVDAKPCALNALIGYDRLEQRDRQRFRIVATEVSYLDLGWCRGC